MWTTCIFRTMGPADSMLMSLHCAIIGLCVGMQYHLLAVGNKGVTGRDTKKEVCLTSKQGTGWVSFICSLSLLKSWAEMDYLRSMGADNNTNNHWLWHEGFLRDSSVSAAYTFLLSLPYSHWYVPLKVPYPTAFYCPVPGHILQRQIGECFTI